MEAPITMENDILSASASASANNSATAWLERSNFSNILRSLNASLENNGEKSTVTAEDYSYKTIIEELKTQFPTIQDLRKKIDSPDKILLFIYQIYTLMMAPLMSPQLFAFYETLLLCLHQNTLLKAETAINTAASLFVQELTPRGRKEGRGFAKRLRLDFDAKKDDDKDDKDVVPDNSIAAGWFPVKSDGCYTSSYLARAITDSNAAVVKKILDRIETLTHAVTSQFCGSTDYFQVTNIAESFVCHDVTKTNKSRSVAITFDRKIVLKVITESRNNNDVFVVENSAQFRAQFGNVFPSSQGNISIPHYKRLCVFEAPEGKTSTPKNISTTDSFVYIATDRLDMFYKDDFFNMKVWPAKLGGQSEVSMIAGPPPTARDNRSYEL